MKDEIKEKNNLAENIIYGHLYNEGKITEEYYKYRKVKEGK